MRTLYKPATDEWMTAAACTDEPVELFFPPRGVSKQVAWAKQICAGCPVSEECLAVAICTGPGKLPAFGVWGGHTETERKQLRRAGVDVVTQCRAGCGQPVTIRYRGQRGRVADSACQDCS